MALWKCPNKHQNRCMGLVVFLFICHRHSLNSFLAVLYQCSSLLTWKNSTAIPVLSLFWPEMETCQNTQEYCEWGVLKSPLGLQTHFYMRSEQGCEPRCLEIDYCINLLCHLSAFITNSHCISWTRLHFFSATQWQKKCYNINLQQKKKSLVEPSSALTEDACFSTDTTGNSHQMSRGIFQKPSET